MPIAGASVVVTTTLIALLAGCLSVEGVPCGDRVCAPGAACDEVRGVCLTREQVLACEGKVNLDPCTIGGAEGSCHDGACFVPFCGDHIRNGTEECEDANLGGADCQTLGFYDAAGLACTSHCTFDAGACAGYCGDRIANDVEVCDGQIPASESCLEFGFDAGALSCRSSCVPDISRCEPGIEHTVENLTGAGNLRAVWGTGPDNVYVVAASKVMHWNGTTWTDLAAPSALGLAGVWGIGSDVFVVGGINRLPAGTGQGVLLRWNGSTWTQMASPVNEALVGVWGSSATNVFAVGYNGAAIRFNGTSWSTLNSRTTQNLLAIWGSGASDIWAVGEAGTVDHWTGTQWTVATVGVETLSGVSGSGPNDVYAVGNNGAILRFRNNTWTIQPSFTTTWLEGVWSLSNGEFITIGSGEIYRFNNGTVDTIMPAANNLSGTWASGLDNIYVVGDGGAVVRMRISAWSGMASGTTQVLRAVWGSSPTDVIAVGFSTVLRWNGVQWMPETCSGGGILQGIWGSSANDVIAVGTNGAICRWTGTWASSSAGASYALYGVWGSAATNVYAVGHDNTSGAGGVILHWTGSTWAPDASAGVLIDYAYAVWGSGANDVYVVGALGTGGAIVHWDGIAWSRVTTSWTPYAVWGVGPRDVFVAGTEGMITHWNGRTWAERSFDPTHTFNALWGTGPSNVYAAGTGAIVHWTGSSWSPMKRNTATGPEGLLGLWGTSTGRDLYAVGGQGTIMHRVRSCSSTESSCDDGDDEDCDGLIDCADTDCGSAASCGSGGACAGFATLACNTSVSATTAGGTTSIDANGCDNWGRTGRERVYRVQPATGGTVTATLSGLTRDVDLVVLGQTAAGSCDPFSGCTVASAQSGIADETVSFAAQANESYYLVVDGFGGTSSSFTLSVECL